MKKSGRLLPKQRLLTRLRVRAGRYRALWECLLLLGGGFLFSGARLLGQALPLAACLVAIQPFGWRSLCAAVGAAAGYLLQHGTADGAPFAALTLLMLTAVTVFQGTRLPAAAWFMPLMASIVTAVLGAVGLLEHSRSLGTLCRWAAQSLMAGVMTAALRSAFGGSAQGRLLLWAGAAAGLAALHPSAGVVLAAVLLPWSAELSVLSAVGLALDLSSGTPCMTAALLLPAVVCRFLPRRSAPLRLAVCLVLPAAVLSLFGALHLSALLSLAVGAPLGLLLRQYRPMPTVSPDQRERSGQRLQNAARVLETLGHQLPEAAHPLTQSETDSMFDGAAERVCRCCPRFHRCWKQRAAATYNALTDAADRILERGIARAEDFAEEFAHECCHLDGFITAINQELDGVLYRRRYRAQLAESRRIVGESFLCMAEYLRALPQQEPSAAVCYQPVIGISSAGRGGSRINGDRGACFPGAAGEYFILLCDGMGTGAEAAHVGAETVHMLRDLLSSGMDCGSALRLLNSTYLLRGSGCFATVDLVRLDLCTGHGVLYKWGSAPSYLRQEGTVRRLGHPAPPPGLSPGRCFEEYGLELTNEALLVLVSDGAGNENTMAEISSFTGDLPRELAALLIAGVSAEDDRTAVVVGLRP